MEIDITSLPQLESYAAQFLRDYKKGGVFGLKGDLGAGKSTFVRAVITNLAKRQGVEPPRVTSPTYVIHQSYREISPPIEHYDLYRLEIKNEQELVEIGFEDSLRLAAQTFAYIFVEWPEKAQRLEWLHLTALLQFQLGTDSRKIRIA